MHDVEPFPLSRIVNVFRENPSLQYRDADVDMCHDKLMDDPEYAAWWKDVPDKRRSEQMGKAQQAAIDALHFDHQRAAWHVFSSYGMPEFHETERPAARAALYGSARAGLFLGMQSQVSVGVLVVTSGLAKPLAGAMRKRLLQYGYLHGTVGRPNNHPLGGQTARILVPLPQCPSLFDPERDLPSLSDEDVSAIRRAMNEPRLRRRAASRPSRALDLDLPALPSELGDFLQG